MADDTDLTPLLQYLNGTATTGAANQAQLAAYDAVLKNLQGELGDYSKLGPAGYKNITAQHLGSSALAGIAPDAQARGDEQAAISELSNIAQSGGLELSDRNALNQLEQGLSRNNAARQNSLRNQFAARGQLGSGAELAMDLSNNQNAAMNANTHGEDIAAQAQKRAMQAILDKGSMARSLSNDDYARKKAAAEAADSIARANAAMATDASKYNNNLAGQTYDDALKKLQGETGLTNSMNTALLGKGGQTSAGITSQGNLTNQLIRNIPRGSGGGGGTSPTSNGDVPDTPGTQNTLNYDANLQPNPTEDATAGSGDTWDSLLDDGSAYA